MNDLHREQLLSVLQWGSERFRETGALAGLAPVLERLTTQLDQACVLAVVGCMKAGKSTFINALLGEEVARVGVTETTATINRFRYGSASDPARPVRCYWRGGRYEDVGPDFLHGLQGNDVEVLRRAKGIAYLEYQLPNRYLRDVTLVDTPGTAAVVDEHQNRTAEFLNLQRQLRARHDEETQQIGSAADAVIYLSGPVSRTTDDAFLKEFVQATGGRSRALNAIGVMAKIDLQPEIVTRKDELAAKISRQLRDSLNTVVPVSAGVYRAIQQLQADRNRQLLGLMAKLRKIPPARLAKLLDSDELCALEFDDCPVSAAERRVLRGDMPWTVFTTVARLAADATLSGMKIVQQLEALAGFAPLKEVLERHFFKRARFLRCYRILGDARRVVNEVRYRHLPEFRKRDREDQAQRNRFMTFIRSARGDPAVAKELEALVASQCGTAAKAECVEATLRELDRKLGALFHEMDEYNADFEALNLLEQHPQICSASEREELQCLFGLYGVEPEQRLPGKQATPEYVGERQQAWNLAGLLATDPARQQLAERAVARYGVILSERAERPE